MFKRFFFGCSKEFLISPRAAPAGTDTKDDLNALTTFVDLESLKTIKELTVINMLTMGFTADWITDGDLDLNFEKDVLGPYYTESEKIETKTLSG